MTKRRTLCEKSDVLIFRVTDVDVVVLPKLQTLLFGQIHLIVGLYAEGVIPRIDVWQCMKLLSEAERTVITLFYIQDYPLKKIVEITGMPVGTVKSYISRGKAKLARVMRK